MKKKTIMGFSLFFVLMFSTVIIAIPPSGNYPIGTSWCENDAHYGDQMYTYEGGGVWAGPYDCPGGCTSLGTGGHCKAPPPPGGNACAPASSDEEDGKGSRYVLAAPKFACA